MLENLITQLAEEIQLPPPPPDAKGFFLIPLSPSLQISAKDLEPGLLLRASIAPLPKTNRESILTHLMKANFLGQGTGKSVIGLDEEEKFLTLSHTTSYEVNYKKFKEMVEDFANYLSYWQQELKKLDKEAKEHMI